MEIFLCDNGKTGKTRQVLRCYAAGKGSKSISTELGLFRITVKKYIRQFRVQFKRYIIMSQPYSCSLFCSIPKSTWIFR